MKENLKNDKIKKGWKPRPKTRWRVIAQHSLEFGRHATKIKFYEDFDDCGLVKGCKKAKKRLSLWEIQLIGENNGDLDNENQNRKVGRKSILHSQEEME